MQRSGFQSFLRAPTGEQRSQRRNSRRSETRRLQQEGPQESLPAVTQRVNIVRRSRGTPQRNSQKHFIRRIRERMRSLSEKRGRTGDESGDQFRDGDEYIRREGDQNRPRAVSALDSM